MFSGRNKLLVRRAFVVAALICAVARTPAVGMSNAERAEAFLIQKVCVGSKGNVDLSDPYLCPEGDHLRSPLPGEPLPYHRYDQLAAGKPDRQRHDSFPVVATDGRPVVVNPFDHAPFGTFKEGRDSYSITLVRDGWASSGGTRTFMLGTTFLGKAANHTAGGFIFRSARSRAT
jgi:hypothetical protein